MGGSWVACPEGGGQRGCLGFGVPSAENSHTLWGLREGISRQPFPCCYAKMLIRSKNLQGTSGHTLPLCQAHTSMFGFSWLGNFPRF